MEKVRLNTTSLRKSKRGNLYREVFCVRLKKMQHLITIIMGTAAVIFSFCIGFFLQTNIPKSMATRWFSFRSFEKDGEAYKMIGVKSFKNFLIRTGYNHILAKGLKVSNKSRIELDQLTFKMQQAELIHLMGLAIAFMIAFVSL